MIADIGTTLLQITLFISIGQAGLWLLKRKPYYKHLLTALSIACFVTLSAAMSLLIYAFILSDFSVLSVYKNSHTLKPLIYKITASWGHHEGSILLWCWVMALYSMVMARARIEQPIRLYALHIMGALQTSFTAYTLFTSNPFGLIIPTPAEGLGLNPLLQDIGLAIHPPMLYLGYVGFSAVFALAIAALATQRAGKGFAETLHPWIMLPWVFLTLGIGLGSWWAYRELGWGGWWFWDPVENASFLPWLTATALFHSNIVMKKRGNFQRWVLLLALATFILSMLGTFLVRSGILTSVHSFASDPTRGVYILAMIAVLSAYALFIYFRHSPAITQTQRIALFSREMAMMVNNLLLIISMASILLAMLYPLIIEAINGQLISIGAEYYNATFTALMIPLLFACGLSMFLVWEHNPTVKTRKRIMLPVTLSFTISAIILLIIPTPSWLLSVGVLGGIWIAISTIFACYKLHRNNRPITTIAAMATGHLALAIFVLAASFYGAYHQQYDFAMQVGDTQQAGDNALAFKSITHHHGKNYISQSGELHISNAQRTTRLTPEERYYPISDQFTTEADIQSFITHDLYATIKRAPALNGDQEATTRPLMVQFYKNPAMSWLWLSILMLGCAGVIATYQTIRRPQS